MMKLKVTRVGFDSMKRFDFFSSPAKHFDEMAKYYYDNMNQSGFFFFFLT